MRLSEALSSPTVRPRWKGTGEARGSAMRDMLFLAESILWPSLWLRFEAEILQLWALPNKLVSGLIFVRATFTHSQRLRSGAATSQLRSQAVTHSAAWGTTYSACTSTTPTVQPTPLL